MGNLYKSYIVQTIHTRIITNEESIIYRCGLKERRRQYRVNTNCTIYIYMYTIDRTVVNFYFYFFFWSGKFKMTNQSVNRCRTVTNC